MSILQVFLAVKMVLSIIYFFRSPSSHLFSHLLIPKITLQIYFTYTIMLSTNNFFFIYIVILIILNIKRLAYICLFHLLFKED